MKNLLFLLVALTPTPSSAREAILDVFSPEAKPDFAVLAPQLRGTVDLEEATRTRMRGTFVYELANDDTLQCTFDLRRSDRSASDADWD